MLVREGSDSYRPIFIEDIFAANKTASGYFANWVSDSLRVVSGEIVRYIHEGWDSKWENEEFIAVEDGIVKKRVCKNNRMVSPGIDDMNLKLLLDSLDLGEIPRKMVLQVRYSDFDAEGNPVSCRIIVNRGSGDSANDDRIVTAIEEFMLKSRSLPVYYIDDEYTSYPYIISVSPSSKD